MSKSSKTPRAPRPPEQPANPEANPNLQEPADQRGEGPADQMVIKDLETLKVLTEPLRLQILELMAQPCTVKVVAKSLNLPPTKLYYHVSQLEEYGIIRVVATRIVSGIIEKQYQVTAKSFSVDRSLLSLDKPDWKEWDVIWHNLIDGISLDIRRGLESGLIQMGDEHPVHQRLMIGRSIIKLTPDQAVEFSTKLRELLKEYDQKPSKAAQPWHGHSPAAEAAQPWHGHSPAAEAAQPYSILVAFHLHSKAEVKEGESE